MLQCNIEKISSKLFVKKGSILCVCSDKYRASNAQALYHIDIAGLLPTFCHIIPIISSIEQFSERLYKT